MIGFLQGCLLRIVAEESNHSRHAAVAAHEVRRRHLSASVPGKPTTSKPYAEVNDPLPPPMFDDNWANKTEHCIFGDDFKAITTASKVKLARVALNLLSANTLEMQDWAWVNEGRPTTAAKWGFVSMTPGSVLNITVWLLLHGVHISERTTCGVDMATAVQVPVQAHERSTAQSVVLGVGLLDSYEHMGTAVVQCQAGCTCSTATFNTANPDRVSMIYWKPVSVVMHQTSSFCHLQVTNSMDTESGEHKLKVRKDLL